MMILGQFLGSQLQKSWMAFCFGLVLLFIPSVRLSANHAFSYIA